MVTAFVDAMRIEPGAAPKLSERDPGARPDGVKKSEGLDRLAELTGRLEVLHDRLWAEATRAVLLVLQGVDASGKDGTIKHVLTGVNPQGTRIASFKAPSATELAHDYLWRVHAVCPQRGELGIFNRSHYEDVIAVRVRKLAPKAVWSKRYAHIREFERLLVDEGTTHRQDLPPRLEGGAGQAAPGTARHAGEALEVPARRPRRPQALGRVHRRVRGRDPRDLDRMGALARRPGRPQLGAQPVGRGDPRRRVRAARPAVPAG